MPLQKNQLNSGEYNNSLKSSKNYKKSEPIIDFPRKPTFFKIRKLIHIFKAMFNEANIPLGNNYEIELSHHYNIEKFEKIDKLINTSKRDNNKFIEIKKIGKTILDKSTQEINNIVKNEIKKT